MAENPSVSSFRLERGPPTVIRNNRPVKFRIVFNHGTSIEGVIPPNCDFAVCDHGDIAEFSITIDDDSTKKPELV